VVSATDPHGRNLGFLDPGQETILRGAFCRDFDVIGQETITSKTLQKSPSKETDLQLLTNALS
jgi:hypothetical protein